MQHGHQLRRSLPAEYAAADKRGAPDERKSCRRMKSMTTETLASEDPPDHREELLIQARRRQLIFSRQGSGSTLSTSSSTSASHTSTLSASSATSASHRIPSPRHSPRKQQVSSRQFHNFNQQKQAYGNRSMATAQDSLLPTLYNVLLPFINEENSKSPDKDESTPLRLNGRREYPYPPDIIKFHTGAAKGMKKEHTLRNSAVMDALGSTSSYISEEHVALSRTSTASDTSANTDKIPAFVISNTLQASESAEELRQLIEAMRNEFLRLSSSKMRAEAKAKKLETDLSVHQHEMEKRFESLSVENERLRTDVNESATKLGHAMAENRMLRRKNAKLQKLEQTSEAKAAAAAAEEINNTTNTAIKLLMEKVFRQGPSRNHQ